ncbi:MAG TPA: ferritin-like domain-containing protein [Terriglobales bacterium]|jgi:ferritin-like metal-binding protein YciE
MKTETFQDFYQKLLADAFDAENQLIKALPKMAKAASSDELRSAFEEHLEQTREHASRIEEIFESSGIKPKRAKCKGMQGLIEEGAEVIEEFEEGDLRDAALITAAQKVEHYEISGYGSLKTIASMLGESEAQSQLEQTLQEEKETDQKLNQIAESINPGALEQAGEEQEERVGTQSETRSRRRRVA